jgi:hypothetical protein
MQETRNAAAYAGNDARKQKKCDKKCRKKRQGTDVTLVGSGTKTGR